MFLIRLLYFYIVYIFCIGIPPKTKKGDDETIVTEIIPVKKPIMELEEALTRIQTKKSRYIEMLNDFGINYDKLELDKEKVKIYKNKSSLKIRIDDLIDGEDLE